MRFNLVLVDERIYGVYTALMNTKVIFNIDKKLKVKAMQKAGRQGLTLSSVLNLATQAYVDDRITLTAFERDLMQGMADVRAGRVHALDDVIRDLKIKLQK